MRPQATVECSGVRAPVGSGLGSRWRGVPVHELLPTPVGESRTEPEERSHEQAQREQRKGDGTGEEREPVRGISARADRARVKGTGAHERGQERGGGTERGAACRAGEARAHRYTTSHSAGHTRTTKYQKSWAAPKRATEKWRVMSPVHTHTSTPSAQIACTAWKPMMR